ncbi:MAG: MarR family winged helix-turn-helix transcriptional regulator [Chthoniobacterales bacterium]
MNKALPQRDYQAMAAFRYGLRKFLRFSKDFLAEVDLTPEQYEVLLALTAYSPKAGLVIRELSEQLQVKHHTAVSLIDRLVRQKLVTRQRDALDRRKVHVRLTASGTALTCRLASVHRDTLRKLVPELSTALNRIKS